MTPDRSRIPPAEADTPKKKTAITIREVVIAILGLTAVGGSGAVTGQAFSHDQTQAIERVSRDLEEHKTAEAKLMEIHAAQILDTRAKLEKHTEQAIDHRENNLKTFAGLTLEISVIQQRDEDRDRRLAELASEIHETDKDLKQVIINMAKANHDK